MSNPTIPENMLTVAQAAEKFSINPLLLYDAINKGKLRAYTILGIRPQLVKIEDVRKLLEPQPKN